jgi:iron(III) transport system substrate-binding protein
MFAPLGGAGRRTLVFLAACAMLVPACGAPVQQTTTGRGGDLAATDLEVFKKFAGMAEPERTKALVEAAKKEGSLTVYGSSNLASYLSGFEKAYGIKTTLLETDNDAMVTRLTQEAAADRYLADYVDGAGPLMQTLDNAGLLGFYSSPLRDKLPPEAQGKNWTGNRRQPYLAAYNTEQVPPDQIPDDYLDFADPKWKGRISVELGDYEWYMGLVQYYEQVKGMSRTAIDAALSKVMSNARTADGHSDQSRLLAAGQYAVALAAYYHHIKGLADHGAPVTWGGAGKPTVQPIIMHYDGIALTSHAPHPAAATLFLDYVLSPDGQAISESEGELSAAVGPNDPLAGLEVRMTDMNQYLENGAQWAAAYDKLLRHAQ